MIAEPMSEFFRSWQVSPLRVLATAALIAGARTDVDLFKGGAILKAFPPE